MSWGYFKTMGRVKILYSAFLFFFQILLSENLYIAGFAGVTSADFQKVKSLGANAVIYSGYLPPIRLKDTLKKAESLGINLIGRAEGKSKFQKSSLKIDFESVARTIGKVFSGTEIAENPFFLGYYIIDEPCHRKKWDINVQEFKRFYNVVKGVNKNIRVMVNFGHLSCLEKFISQNGRIVDIAAFTVTPWKLRKFHNYISSENLIAKRIKQKYHDLMIIAMVSVYEYPAKGEKIPSPDWIKKVSLKILDCKNFDGIIFYSWNPSGYMGKTIKDVIYEKEYREAFREIFEKVKSKF